MSYYSRCQSLSELPSFPFSHSQLIRSLQICFVFPSLQIHYVMLTPSRLHPTISYSILLSENFWKECLLIMYFLSSLKFLNLPFVAFWFSPTSKFSCLSKGGFTSQNSWYAESVKYLLFESWSWPLDHWKTYVFGLN